MKAHHTYRWFRTGIWIGMFALASCSQIALKQGEINASLYQGNVQQAYDVLNTDIDKWKKDRNALLYYWNKGTLAWMLGKYQESSELFLTSDYYLEDMYRNYANTAASLFINDKVRQYSGEDHERVLFHYYQILNFMQLGKTESAQVQARRLMLELYRLDDRYKDAPKLSIKRYQEDAFAHLLIALVFESAGDLDNSYISYKNAYRIFNEDYAILYGVQMPAQLKQDIMRMAWRLGFYDDLERYEKEFGLTYDRKQNAKGGNTVFFWNNGLSPTKQEVSLNFAVIRGTEPGWVVFVNTDYGFAFPMYVGEDKTANGSSFSQVDMVRATFPKYFTRGAYFNRAKVLSNGQEYPMEIVEDVSAVAHKELDDRFNQEIGKTLLRLALKKAAEYELRKNNPDAGAALGLVNFFTEQADTRSWESLPHQISYTRLSLEPGMQNIVLRTETDVVIQDHSISLYVPKQGMVFGGFHTLQPGQVVR